MVDKWGKFVGDEDKLKDIEDGKYLDEDEMMYFKNESPNQYEDIVKIKQNNM